MLQTLFELYAIMGVVCAFGCLAIARNRGASSPLGWALFGLFFGVIGLLVAAAAAVFARPASDRRDGRTPGMTAVYVIIAVLALILGYMLVALH